MEWVGGLLHSVDREAGRQQPGRPSLRSCNRRASADAAPKRAVCQLNNHVHSWARRVAVLRGEKRRWQATQQCQKKGMPA